MQQFTKTSTQHVTSIRHRQTWSPTHKDPTHKDPTHKDPTRKDPTNKDSTHKDPTHKDRLVFPEWSKQELSK